MLGAHDFCLSGTFDIPAHERCVGLIYLFASAVLLIAFSSGSWGEFHGVLPLSRGLVFTLILSILFLSFTLHSNYGFGIDMVFS